MQSAVAVREEKSGMLWEKSICSEKPQDKKISGGPSTRAYFRKAEWERLLYGVKLSLYSTDNRCDTIRAVSATAQTPRRTVAYGSAASGGNCCRSNKRRRGSACRRRSGSACPRQDASRATDTTALNHPKSRGSSIRRKNSLDNSPALLELDIF